MRVIEYEQPQDKDGKSAVQTALAELSSICEEEIREAVEARDRLGIEKEWNEDQAYYEGYERPEMIGLSGSRDKPPYDAIGDNPTGSDNERKSEIFVNLTKHYTDTAAGRLMDIVQPGNKKAWSVNPTPIPGIADAVEQGKIPTHIDQTVENSVRQVASEQGVEDEEQVQGMVDEARTRALTEAEARYLKSKRAALQIETKILDYLVECGYVGEARDVVDSTAQLGTGVMKGPVMMHVKRGIYRDGRLVVESVAKPGSVSVDIRNCFPDMAAGERVEDGDYHWEYDSITRSQVRKLAKDPAYFAGQIARALRSEPGENRVIKDNQTQWMRDSDPEIAKRTYELWTGYRYLTADQLRAIRASVKDPARGRSRTLTGDEDLLEELEEVPVRVVMLGKFVIQIVANPISTGDIPYDYMIWSRRYGMPWGRGVPRICRDAQRIITGASRQMMNNAGIAGGPILVINRNVISPTNGDTYRIASFEVFEYDGEDVVDSDVRRAMMPVNIAMYQREFEAIIMLGERLMENITGLPNILRGQTGQGTPDTVGGLYMLNQNATSPMRRVARRLDDRCTEPHITRYYRFVIEHDADDIDLEDADVMVDAQGSVALVQRDMETQNIFSLLDVSTNPTYGIDPEKVMRMALRSLQLKEEDYTYDSAEKRQLHEQLIAQSQQPHPALEVEQIRNQREQMKLQAQAEQKERDREMELTVESMRRQSGDLQTKVDEANNMIQAALANKKIDAAAETQLRVASEKTTQAVMQIQAGLAELQATLSSQERQAKAKPQKAA